MKKAQWKKKIKESCIEAGTYKPFFDSVIDTLAGIMETRDNAQEKFDASGGQTIVKHTNKGGATNIVKNPALAVLMECNAQALAFWRDLGLTPAGYKKLNADVIEKSTGGGLERLLEKITG
jgi:hypothetical protein